MSALLHQPAVLLFTFVLILLFPLADAFVYARLQTALHVYLWNIVSLWTLTLIAIALLYRDGFTLSQFGQNSGLYPRNVITVAGVILLVAALVVINKLRKRKITPEQYANKSIESANSSPPRQPNASLSFLWPLPLACARNFFIAAIS